jgi:hypothetical protein
MKRKKKRKQDKNHVQPQQPGTHGHLEYYDIFQLISGITTGS